MSGGNFIVPARSWDSIEERTSNWRQVLELDRRPYFPIMEVLEKVLDNRMNFFRVEVDSMAEMGAAEGYTDPQGQFIIFREDVYQEACNGGPRARFTAAHEFGHFDLHTGTPLARASRFQDVKPFRLSEPQANHFASCLLMPASSMRIRDTVDEVMERHGVSHGAASYRLDYLRKKGRLNG